jgi:hypothetical protein
MYEDVSCVGYGDAESKLSTGRYKQGFQFSFIWGMISVSGAIADWFSHFRSATH